jgi:hypothetical protein
MYRHPNESLVSAKVIHDDSRSKGNISGLSSSASTATKIVYDSNRPFLSHQRYSNINSKSELQSKIQVFIYVYIYLYICILYIHIYLCSNLFGFRIYIWCIYIYTYVPLI